MAFTRYFLTMYGSQRGTLNRPQFSHTYATFTERQYDDDDVLVGERALTISWLPADGDIDPFRGPEPGRNFSYEETVGWLNAGGSFDRWESPETEIQQVLFESAVDRCAEFASGTLQYVMVDREHERPHLASNCIHAVMDLPIVVASYGVLPTGLRRGIEASQFAYSFLSPFFAM